MKKPSGLCDPPTSNKYVLILGPYRLPLYYPHFHPDVPCSLPLYISISAFLTLITTVFLIITIYYVLLELTTDAEDAADMALHFSTIEGIHTKNTPNTNTATPINEPTALPSKSPNAVGLYRK
jgi:hypothetical protein